MTSRKWVGTRRLKKVKVLRYRQWIYVCPTGRKPDGNFQFYKLKVLRYFDFTIYYFSLLNYTLINNY